MVKDLESIHRIIFSININLTFSTLSYRYKEATSAEQSHII